MKKLFIIKDTLENKISYYHLALFLILLPYDLFYTQLIVISLILHSLIHLSKQRIRHVLSWQNLTLTSVFIITIIGMTWSRDNGEAAEYIVRQLAIFLFPVLFTVTGLALHQYKKNLLVLFGLSCIITILYLYADAIYTIAYYELPARFILSPSFINHNFSSPIGIHATYLSLYVSLSIASFLWFLFNEKSKTSLILYAGGIVILTAGLVQLASRSVLIATISFLFLAYPMFIQGKKIRLKFILITLIISVITLFAILKIDSLKKRYITELKEDFATDSPQKDISEPRIVRWNSAIELIKQSPIIGYGSGSPKRLLKEKYFEDRLYRSYLHELNTHNQYLNFLLVSGILGLSLFLITLYAGFALAWRNRDIVFICFMLLISITAFSENILDVNKGIFFYAFFFSFFMKTSVAATKNPAIKNLKLNE